MVACLLIALQLPVASTFSTSAEPFAQLEEPDELLFPEGLGQLEDQDDLFQLGLDSRPPGWLVVTSRIGGALSGMVAAALTHELGHALVAWGHGRGFLWPTPGGGGDVFLPPWQTRPRNTELPPGELRNIALGGFLISEIAVNVLLEVDAFPKSDIFVTGFVFYHVINQVMYVIRDIIDTANARATGPLGPGSGDIRDIDRGGIPREAVYAYLLTSSAFALARVLENPDFLRLSFWSEATEPY